MKKTSIIGITLSLVLAFAATSCTDMFDIESSRVSIDHNDRLKSTADSVYSTIGLVHLMQQVADRYVLLGEVRGDLLDVNESTKTSLRNLANFDFDDDNEYLQVRDYYAIINNCNYIIANMDTTLRSNNRLVMTDEYAAAVGIRAWTYLQLAINYGKVPFYTNPITTVAESEREYDVLGVKEIAAELLPELRLFADYKMPAWTEIKVGMAKDASILFPPIRPLIAEYELWSGDYLQASKDYYEWLTNNKNITMQIDAAHEIIYGLVPLGDMQVDIRRAGNVTVTGSSTWEYLNFANRTVCGNGLEAIHALPMEASSENGTVSEIGNLFYSGGESMPQLTGSASWRSLGTRQPFIKGPSDRSESTALNYSVQMDHGDSRNEVVTSRVSSDELEYEYINKYVHSRTLADDGVNYTVVTNNIVLNRRGLIYLRAAEAFNCLAAQMSATDTIALSSSLSLGRGQVALAAFDCLKDGFNILFPKGDNQASDLRPYCLGVHSRGCGDVYLDTALYIVSDVNVADYVGKDTTTIAFPDTINFIEDKIIDELALETAFEGNRFGDLIRFANHKSERGQDGPAFLAGKVACRKGETQRDESLYNKLLDTSNWYLPFK